MATSLSAAVDLVRSLGASLHSLRIGFEWPMLRAVRTYFAGILTT